MNKPNVLVSISLLFVFIISAIYYHFDTQLRKAESDYKKQLKEQRIANENAIDSLVVVVNTARAQIDTLKVEKVELTEALKPIKKKIKKYEEPRYYPDATFDTESKRIAESLYRHRSENRPVGQGESDRDWQDYSERTSLIRGKRTSETSDRKTGSNSFQPRTAA